jgi:hypothetical protein
LSLGKDHREGNAIRTWGGIAMEPRLLAEAFSKASKANLELYETKLKISRKGSPVIYGFKGDKEILLRSITSIQFKKPGAISDGFIQFSFIGGQESKGGMFGSIAQASLDENAITFNKRDYPAFEAIKAAIDKQIALLQDAGTPATHSDIDDLEKLAILRDKGILTEEEFQAKKKQILGL